MARKILSRSAYITLTTNFGFQGSKSTNFNLPSAVITMGDLLQFIGREIGFTFVDAGVVNLRPDVEVSINGKDILFFPIGLRTELKEGDAVEISMTPLGGG
jgi:hypothetical protein